MAVDIPYADEQPPNIVTATTVNAPTSPTDTLYVTIPSFASRDQIAAAWQAQGTTYPAANQTVLVAFDETGHAWVLVW